MARPLLAIAAAACAGSLALAASVRPAAPTEFDCDGFLRMHGMLRRASAVCGFAAYNAAIVDRARACFDAVGGRRGAEEVRSGVAEFERLQSARPRDALCVTLAARFPMVVRP